MTSWTFDQMVALLDQFLATEELPSARQRKRQRILAAATELFVRHGYRRTSMDEVARQAGIAKGTLYLYFKTKSDLLLHAIGEEKKRYLGRFRELLRDDLDPTDRLRRYLREAFLVAQEMPLVSRLNGGDRELLAVLADLGPDVRDRTVEVQKEFGAWMLRDAAAAGGWSEEELRRRAQVLLTLVYSANALADPRVRGEVALEPFAATLATVVVDGLVAPARVSEEGGAG